jgi:hypothetical protein
MTEILPKSPIAEALIYTLINKKTLIIYANDCILALDKITAKKNCQGVNHSQ